MKALCHKLFITALIATVLISCEEDRRTRDCEDQKPIICAVDSGKVNIRIFNFTKMPLCNFKLFNTLHDTLDPAVFFGFIDRDSLSCFVPVDSTLLGAAFSYTVGAGEFEMKKTSASFEKAPKSFVTYNVFLQQVSDTDTVTKVVTSRWETYQIPTVENF